MSQMRCGLFALVEVCARVCSCIFVMWSFKSVCWNTHTHYTSLIITEMETFLERILQINCDKAYWLVNAFPSRCLFPPPPPPSPEPSIFIPSPVLTTLPLRLSHPILSSHFLMIFVSCFVADKKKKKKKITVWFMAVFMRVSAVRVSQHFKSGRL